MDPHTVTGGLLEIDGRNVTAECDAFALSIPRLVYEADDGASILRFPGPAGFVLILDNPSDCLRALADSSAAHDVKVTCKGMSITHRTRFREEWTDKRTGDRRLLGCLAADRSTEAQWVEEPHHG